jgi:cysteine synthase
MLMGASRELQRANPEVKIVALEPATTAIISGGNTGSHDIVWWFIL